MLENQNPKMINEKGEGREVISMMKFFRMKATSKRKNPITCTSKAR
jgi:hypothetical protein